MTSNDLPLNYDTSMVWAVESDLPETDYDKVVAGAAAHATNSAQQHAIDAAKVMIVDDELINIKVVEKHLRHVGYQKFITTTQSLDGVDLICKRKPDVVLLDIVMPQMNGLEILRIIRADQRFRFLPVLILTACDDDATRREALESGATDFLTKPVDPHELVPRVRNAVLAKWHQDHLENYAQQLTREICQKTEELLSVRKKSHKRYLAGKAEIATEVLHNVGNALHSVNIAVNFLYQTLRDSRLPSLGKVAALMQEHEDELGHFLTEDERGKVIPSYIGELASNLREERNLAMDEIRTVARHLEHIKGIVATQHRYASRSATELVSLNVVLANAEQLSGIASERHAIHVERDLADVPEIVSDEQRLLQVFVNLIKNAVQSIKLQHGASPGAVQIRAHHDASHVCIQISDNGVGISEEHFPQLFSHGFTTKKTGNGFGLHSCANIVKELGGSIQAASDGAGCGATFSVYLPFEQ